MKFHPSSFILFSKEVVMRSRFFKAILIVVFLISMTTSGLSGAEVLSAGGQSEDQKYAGMWVGSYYTDSGVTEKLSYSFSKDEKGQWRGTVRFTNQDGEQNAEFKTLQIADEKMKGKIESPDGQVEVTIEGQFQGDQLEGTYSVSPKGSTDVSEKGTWKVTKSAAQKTGR
jgi:hypothetical protein